MEVTLTDEFTGANIGDKRLNKRLVKIASEIGARPNDSIPAATSGRAEMEAVYRFCDNPKVTPEKILEPHAKATVQRMQQCETVLLVQDTTELDLTRPNRVVEGAAQLGSGQRKGAKSHPLTAFTTEGLCLGTVWLKSFVTDESLLAMSAKERDKHRKSQPIEKKESYRWLEGLRVARDIAAQCPDVRCVCISDSESDIYEMLCEPLDFTPQESEVPAEEKNKQIHLIVRGCQNRSTVEGKIFTRVRQAECVYTQTVSVSKRDAKIEANKNKREQAREAREAIVSVRACEVTICPSYRPGGSESKLPPVTLNAILVEEETPPEGAIPIQWLLITSLPIDDVAAIEEVVNMYRNRWHIELFFKTLKSGCRVEERQFERLDRVLNSVAIYMVIAWRTNYLCYLGRERPDMSCEAVFSRSEWEAVTQVVTGKLPAIPPTLNEMIRLTASLGGYVLRKKTQPGPMTLWRGLQRAYDFSIAWDCFLAKQKNGL